MICNYQNINDFCCKKYSYSYINTTSNNGVVVVDNSATAPVLRTDNTTGITKIITQNSTDPISTCDINDDNEEINEYECYLIYRYQCEGYVSDPPLETFKNSQIDIVNNAYETSLADGVVVTINNKDVILGASIIDQISYKSILSYAQVLYDDDTDAVMPSFSDKNGNIYTLSYTDLVLIFKTYFVKVVYYKNLKDSLVSQILLCSSVDDLQQINWCNNKILVGNIKSTSISPLIVKKSIQDCEDIQQIDYIEEIGCQEDQGTMTGTIAECASVSNMVTITNNFSVPALLEASGGINDDLLINGSIYEEGQYPFSWGSYGSPCGSDNTKNGSHSWSYSVILLPGEVITFGCKDNGFGGGFYGNSSWTLKTCF